MSPTKKRTITAEDLYKLELISDIRISPDGEHVVYTQGRVDAKTEKKYSNLWLVPTKGGEPVQFTYGDQNDSLPRWSPDGKWIAFLSNRADKEKQPQIFLIPFGGGEARRLTEIDGSFGSISWSPDGKRLLCQVRKLDPEALERQKDEQKKKLGVVARHYDRLFYKLDGFGYLPKERWHIWTVEVKTGKGQQITDHPVFDEGTPNWSPDGKWVTFISNRMEDPDQYPDRDDLFVVASSGGELRKIETPAGGKSHPTFSPDGKWIAYYGQEGERQSYRNNNLWVVPVDGSGPACNLTQPYDLHVSSWTINDQAQPEMVDPIWSLDGKTIYFPVSKHGNSYLYAISPDGQNQRPIIEGEGVTGTFSVDAKQEKMAYFYGDLKWPNQVKLVDLTSGEQRQLTHLNESLLRNVELGEVESYWIKGPDGNDLQGWILKPPGFDPAKRYASILEIHGGPQTQYGNFFMHEFYFLAAQGYVVHFSNPRGGRGYGEEHTKAIHGKWGTADYADLMAWTDFVAGQPYIDPERMGVTGGSYGGYMTVWIIGHTQRFKAAVSQRCVSNFVSMWGSSDFNWVFQESINDKAPFEDLQSFWERSPIAYIGNARTPTKVIHSENDLRCPIEQSEQVFVALQRLGVDSEFVRFPDEFHGLSRGGRTDRRIVRLNHILNWFEKHLK